MVAIKAKCILYLIEEVHDAYTYNSGKKSLTVYDSTALTEIYELILVAIM